MKTSKRFIALMLSALMIFSVAFIPGADFSSLLGIEAEAYTNTTIGRITQQQVVGTQTAIDGIKARDFWYTVYAGDYFDGHSEPTDIVIPGLGDGDDYTPQGMTYWEAKNWILISAYDAGGSDPSCIYAIDVATGKFVALFDIYNIDGSANTSHGGGIAASEYNFYFADKASNISYIPLYQMDVAEGTYKKIYIRGTISFAGEMNNANTSYCCYDDGVLWVGNFFLSSDNSYKQPANANSNSMLLGYKLAGNSSEEEWKHLLGTYRNSIAINQPSQSMNYDNVTGTATSNYTVFKNGQTMDITGTVTGKVGNAWNFFGAFPFDENYAYRLEFKANTPNAQMYIISEDWNEVYNVRQYIAAGMHGAVTKIDDNTYHYYIDLPKYTFNKTYNLRFDTGPVDGTFNFCFSDIAITAITDNYLVATQGDFSGTRCTGTISRSIYTGGYSLNGTATRTSSDQPNNAYYQFANANLVEGETYTLTYTSTNADTCMYLFAPAGTKDTSDRAHTKLPHSVYLGQDGLYHYTSTFTAGLKPSGIGDTFWPSVQAQDYAYTGQYILRADQNDLTTDQSRSFTISDISLSKSDLELNNFDRIHEIGYSGYPSYVIAIDNSYDRIQYAMVDNGRLYFSRSWNRNMSADTYLSEIDIFDIDLDITGTYSYTINGRTRNDCYYATGGKSFYNLSMGEALCVIDDYLYMFTESAAYNYRLKEGGNDPNRATQPVDVVWKIDQYALLGEKRLSNDETHVATYEKINSLDEINYTDEYIIVYESEQRDPATRQKYMYALDSNGSYKDEILPKMDAGQGEQVTTGDSLGIIGHPISRYTVEGDILTLYQPENDDIPSIRWNIIGADTGAMRIQNMDTYYGKYKNLYFGSRLIYMSSSAPTTQLDRISIEDCGDGTFRFFYKGDANYYLWCNDGSVESYVNVYNSAYMSEYAFKAPAKLYAGQLEKNGTFHSDAELKHTNTGNLTGEPVDIKYQKMSIYRRAEDTVATGESGLFTDLNAELQADGTYTITLEAYTTGQTVTAQSTDGKPIDFVFVLDTSSSMLNEDVSYWGKSDEPETYDWNLFSDHERFIKYNNTYFRGYSQNTGQVLNANKYFAVNLYNQNDGYDYYIAQNSELQKTSSGGSNNEDEKYGFKGNKEKGYSGGYYWVNRTGDIDRMTSMKASVLELIDQIAQHAEQTGIQHRISIIQYGSDYNTREANTYKNTGMYSTVSGTKMVNYTELDNEVNYNQGNEIFTNAFFPATHDNLKTIVNNISVSGDCDTYVNHGFDMALNVLADQIFPDGASNGRVYGKYENTVDKHNTEPNATACVVHITGGAPGVVGNDSSTATNVANTAIVNAGLMKLYDVNIFSIKLGNPSMSGFNIDNYLEALSSDYPDATSVSNLGTKTASNYKINASINADQNNSGYNNIFDGLFESMGDEIIDTGTDVALNSGSVLQHKLGSNFILSNAKATVKTADIYYDSLGRIYTEEPKASNYTATINQSNETVQVTGFDYSNLFVSDGNSGQKLYLEISGVLLDSEIAESKQGICTEEKTAIYQTAADVTNNIPFQTFPQVNFDLPTYNYVFDYGVDMKSTSIVGTMLSVDNATDRQSTYQKSLTENGFTADISNSLMMSMKPNASETTDYILVQRPLGGYYWAKLNMIPATNVLFEETNFNKEYSAGKTDWITTGNSKNIIQSLSANTDVYGYDSNYSGNDYSNGTAITTTVTKDSNRSDTAAFTFTGTGFDLNASCGPNTGVQLVKVTNSSNEIKKLFIVDTYYNDSSFGTINQVPIVRYNDEYDTYRVESTAAYLESAEAIRAKNTMALDSFGMDMMSAPLSGPEILTNMLVEIGMEDLLEIDDIEIVWFDDDSIFNGGNGANTLSDIQTFSTTQRAAEITLTNTIDSIRIYNPLNYSSANYIEKEQAAQYINVIDNLKSGSLTNGKGNFAYIEGSTVDSADFATYEEKGPTGEFYLTSGTSSSLTFNVSVPNNKSRIMVSMRAVNGPTSAKIGETSIPITSSTEMYYDITDYLTLSADTTVAIQNVGDNLLAINNIKLTGGAVATMAMFNLPRIRMMMASPVTSTVEPNVFEEDNSATSGYTPDESVKNPDPELDAVGEYIINYPENSNNNTDDTDYSDIEALFKDTISRISAFFKKIITFFKTLLA